MLRTLSVFLGLVVILSSGIAIAAWPSAWSSVTPPVAATQSAAELRAAYDRVIPGVTPQSKLARLGLDVAAAAKLSHLGVVERFMPRDSVGFDALAPAVQDCLGGEDRCTAYVFHARDVSSGEMVLLLSGGRVTFKTMSGRAGVAALAVPMLRAAEK